MNATALPTNTDSASQPTFRRFAITRGDGFAGLRLVAARSRPLGPRNVRVAMQAVALNQRDLMVAKGLAGVPGHPIVPASDGAGVVVDVGSEVTTLRVGERVITTFFPDWIAGEPTEASTARALGGSMDGVLAEQVVLPESAWVPVPAHLDAIEAATLTCAGVTAWHALFGVEPLQAGATVVLLGTGGVSIWALQLAKAAGLRVAITSSDDAKLERARQLGADATLNYRSTPAWGEAMHAWTGAGVDRVLDVGGQDTLGQSIRALRTGGSVAVIGRLGGMAAAQFDPAALYGGNKRLVGLMVGSRAMTQALARFVETRRLRPVVDRVFPFQQAADAYAYLDAARHLGKVVVSLS